MTKEFQWGAGCKIQNNCPHKNGTDKEKMKFLGNVLLRHSVWEITVYADFWIKYFRFFSRKKNAEKTKNKFVNYLIFG